MVTIFSPALTVEAGRTQLRVGTPSICTVQAPHCAMPQPYLVPVRPIFSLIAQRSGVSGSTSISNALPLIVRLAIVVSPWVCLNCLTPDAGPETGFVQINILRPRRGITGPCRGYGGGRLFATFRAEGRAIRLRTAAAADSTI